MRRVFALTVLTLAASCGGAPTGPSAVPPPAAGTLASGAYLLTVSMSTSGNSGFSTCVSQTIGGAAPGFAAVFVPTPVHVVRSGNNISIKADDASATFGMALEISGVNVSGIVSGQYGSGGTTIRVSGSGTDGTAAATGTLGPATALGFITGTVTVDSMSCTNNGHTWTLMPRS